MHREPRVLVDLTRDADALAAAPDGADWNRQAFEFDVRLHDAIAAASGNRRLRQEIAKYRLLVRAFCRMTGSSENLRESLKEHRTGTPLLMLVHREGQSLYLTVSA